MSFILRILAHSREFSGIAGTKDSLPWDSNINDGRSVKITGLGERIVSNVPVGSVCAVSNSLDGSVLCIYHNYATGHIQPTTIHSKVQLQDYHNIVDDTILMLGGSQTLTTGKRSIFPLTVKNGLCYLEQRKPTEWEMKKLPKHEMTSIELWDPSKFEDDVNSDMGKNIPLPPTDYSQLPQLMDRKLLFSKDKIDKDLGSSTNSNTGIDNARSATFSHPEKITIRDGHTGNVISEISLHDKDTVTLHNIGDKTEHSPPFPTNDNNIVEQHMPTMITMLEDKTILSSATIDNGDKKRASEPRNVPRVQPTICALEIVSSCRELSTEEPLVVLHCHIFIST